MGDLPGSLGRMHEKTRALSVEKRHGTFSVQLAPSVQRVCLGWGWGFTSLGAGIIFENTFDPLVSFIHPHPQ